MESNRFVKILWTVNGVLLFFGFVFILILIGKEIIENGSSYQEPEIIVGEELAKAKKDGLVLQGLTYGQPEKIYGHDNYLLTVSIRTYNTPKPSGLAFDSRNKLKVEQVDDSRVVNVIFLNMNFEPINVALDKKAFIHTVTYPGENYSGHNRISADTLQKLVTYLISDKDSNLDGIINDDDDADFYTSNCDGSQFSQITNAWNIKSHSFTSSQEILIKYTLRGPEQEEHKVEFFAVYNTQNKKLTELSGLQKTLQEIEAQITQ